jgi:hypothetical protein
MRFLCATLVLALYTLPGLAGEPTFKGVGVGTANEADTQGSTSSGHAEKVFQEQKTGEGTIIVTRAGRNTGSTAPQPNN